MDDKAGTHAHEAMAQGLQLTLVRAVVKGRSHLAQPGPFTLPKKRTSGFPISMLSVFFFVLNFQEFVHLQFIGEMKWKCRAKTGLRCACLVLCPVSPGLCPWDSVLAGSTQASEGVGGEPSVQAF